MMMYAKCKAYIHSISHSIVINFQYHLVGGVNPSEKYESQLGWWHSQYMESHKIHVPNHQPVIYSEEMSTWPGSMLNLSGIVHCQRLPFCFQPGARGLAWRRTISQGYAWFGPGATHGFWHANDHGSLIGGFNPLEKYESQIGSSSQLLGKVEHVPNHQPEV